MQQAQAADGLRQHQINIVTGAVNVATTHASPEPCAGLRIIAVN